MIEGVLLHGLVYFIAQNKASSDFASMVDGVLLRGIVLFHCTERSHLAILQTQWVWSSASMIEGVLYGVVLFNAQSKASSGFAYSLFCGGGTIDCKAVRVVGQGVQVVEVVLSGAYKRGEAMRGQAR